jgi:hypothetical protein
LLAQGPCTTRLIPLEFKIKHVIVRLGRDIN